MGRRRVDQHYKIPNSVVKVVETIIQDYPRRKRLIEYSTLTNELVVNEYVRLNRIIETAIEREEPVVSSMIVFDIINSRGYNFSEATNIASKNLYYRVKRQLIENIAENIHLL